MNERFDAHPEVQKILQSNRAQPGKFAQSMSGLSTKVVSELKKNKFKPVAVPNIPGGVLPVPRAKE
ncbi:hypothetical protein [Paraburkholderia fungorum]|uniref:hypothetical protein n=1 Tax=Paraburkholderia fungorum TaxID=134537 RepID=UPI000A88C032